VDFGTINWLGVVVAFAVNFFVGFLWFGPKTFYPLWWKALGKEPSTEPGTGSNMGAVFGATAIAGLILAISMSVLASYVAQANGGNLSLTSGLSLGLVAGLGIVTAQSLSHRLFGQQGWMVWAIESGGDIACALAIGGVLSLFY
jgi:Protein of unknown function (DUF1761)